MKTIASALVAGSIFAVVAPATAAITLMPGTIIALRGDTVATQRTLVQLDPATGAVLGELVVPGNPSDSLSSLCVLDGELFIAERVTFSVNTVTRIDPATGAAYGNSFLVPSSTLRRRGALLDAINFTGTSGTYNPVTGGQVTGPQFFNPSALPAPYNDLNHSRGVIWNGQTFTALFDDTVGAAPGYNPAGAARLVAFDANRQPILPLSVTTLAQPTPNLTIYTWDIDEFSGNVWTHSFNFYDSTAPHYMQRYNPVTGQSSSFALPFDIAMFSIVPVPTPGAVTIVGVAALFSARRRQRV